MSAHPPLAGQFFVFWDWVHETLTPPKHRRDQWNWDERKGKGKKKAA